jgi:hypothetical protein
MAGEREIPRSEARRLGRDFLREELTSRLKGRPAAFRLVLSLAESGYRIDDDAKAWPASRRRVEAPGKVARRLVYFRSRTLPVSTAICPRAVSSDRVIASSLTGPPTSSGLLPAELGVALSRHGPGPAVPPP